MKIPSPAHTISQNNIRDVEQQKEQSDIVTEKPVEIPPDDSANEVNDATKSAEESQETDIKNDIDSEVKEEQNDEDKT